MPTVLRIRCQAMSGMLKNALVIMFALLLFTVVAWLWIDVLRWLYTLLLISFL